MSRQFKFRAWHKGYPGIEPKMLYADRASDVLRWKDDGQPIEIMQFTGLFDKHGKEIYAGDYDQNYDVVHWCDRRAGWALATYDHPTKEFIHCNCYSCEGNFDIMDDIENFEVIGNIHEQNTPLKTEK